MLHPFLEDLSGWTLRDVARRRLSQTPDRRFIQVVDGEAQTYGEFISSGAAIARFLMARGVGKGSAVGIFCQPGLAPLHGWLAAGLIGAIDVTVNPALRGEVLAHPLRTTRPRTIIIDAELMPVLAGIAPELDFVADIIVVGEVGAPPWSGPTLHDYAALTGVPAEIPEVAVTPRDASTIMFTSGTTGPSKAVVIPHRQTLLMAHQVLAATGLSDVDTYYCAHPLNHIAGKFMGVLATFLAGGRLVLDRRFDAATWLTRLVEYDVTMSIAHGPMIEMIFATPPREADRTHAMRRLMCCPLPKGIGPAFEERFGLRGVEMWGMTEIGCPIWTDLESSRRSGSCGRPLKQWYEVDVVDPLTDEPVGIGQTGEFVVRPKHPYTTMLGYLDQPEATVEAWRNLWFHTGDAGYRDAEGFFYFVDRMRDRIRRRAENISSFDIETAAMKFPGVTEAAAVGVASGMEGDDDIKLCIVASADVSIDPIQLTRFLLRALPHFMVPRYVEVLDALPRTATNKVRKRQLVEMGVDATTWDRHKSGINLRDLQS